MKLSSLKFCMAKSRVVRQSEPAASGNHSRSSGAGLSQMRFRSRHRLKPRAYGLMLENHLLL